jgi:hypothetical protein
MVSKAICLACRFCFVAEKHILRESQEERCMEMRILPSPTFTYLDVNEDKIFNIAFGYWSTLLALLIFSASLRFGRRRAV